MAVTTIHPIKSTLKKALDYITDPQKTEEKLLVSSYGCSVETADIEMEFTLKQCYQKGNNLAHHLIQSFEPGEVSYEDAHRIGKELAEEILGGKYEYVLTTHIDKGHVHNHLIFCAADFVQHRKYISNKKSLYGIRNVSDRLCREHGLSVIIPGKEKGKSWKEYQATREGKSWKEKLRVVMDSCIRQAKDYDDFLRLMQENGYEIKQGKYTSFRAAGQQRFTRGKTLGTEYTEERIRERIAGSPKQGFTVRKESELIRQLIDLQNDSRVQESGGFAHWAKLNNLKQAAKTLNFLMDNNLTSHAELIAKIKELSAASEQAAGSIKELEKKLNHMAVILKQLNAYRQTRPVYEAYQKAKDKEEFSKQHQAELIIYEATVKNLNALKTDGKKLPPYKELRKQYEQITAEKDKLYQEYRKLNQKVRQHETVRANLEQLIRPESNKDRGKEKESSIQI